MFTYTNTRSIIFLYKIIMHASLDIILSLPQELIILPTNEAWRVFRNTPVCFSVRLSGLNLILTITFELSYYSCLSSSFSSYQTF